MAHDVLTLNRRDNKGVEVMTGNLKTCPVCKSIACAVITKALVVDEFFFLHHKDVASCERRVRRAAKRQLQQLIKGKERLRLLRRAEAGRRHKQQRQILKDQELKNGIEEVSNANN